jgi:hypothetical protein
MASGTTHLAPDTQHPALVLALVELLIGAALGPAPDAAEGDDDDCQIDG